MSSGMKGLIVGVMGVVALVLTLGAFGAKPNVASAQTGCGPMDVVFVIDDTGSMGGAIANVKAEAASLVAQIDTASGSDFQLGLVTFKDFVVVVDDLNGAATVEANILGLSATGGFGLPESSAEALNTVINGLDVADRPAFQTGDFDGVFRAAAVKIIILITDAPPAGGFDDTYTPIPDDAFANDRAVEAKAADILISAIFVPTGGDYAGQKAIMQDYATTTDGIFIETAADGTGTADAIADIIAKCGSATVEILGNKYCIVGTSTGIGWTWNLQGVKPGFVATGTVAVGALAPAIANAWVTSLNNTLPLPPPLAVQFSGGNAHCFKFQPGGQTLEVNGTVITTTPEEFNPTIVLVPPLVGGITELLVGDTDASGAAEGSGLSSSTALAAVLAAGALVLAAGGGLYARRRFLR